MAFLRAFRALRPTAATAARIAAVPYDVVSTAEARALAAAEPLSFLHVSRAEVDLPPDTDPYSEIVYERSATNFTRLRDTALVLETEPSLYFYRLRRGDHVQTGLAGCFSIDEYDKDVIRKHERTRRDKEDDRTRHMVALRAQTGLVFLTYAAVPEVDVVARRVTETPPLFEFTAADGVQHTLWRIFGGDADVLVAAFAEIPALYIADGHHRAASASRARNEMRERSLQTASLGDGADFTTMLAVAFPHDQVRILAYNRIVRGLAGLSPQTFLEKVGERFAVTPGSASPGAPGEIAMYFEKQWHTLRALAPAAAADIIGRLDVTVLQEHLLGPILQIADVRTDPRIDFIGGARGTRALEAAVDEGPADVAFSLFPVSVADLMAVSDAGGIMPPKSTWFEPKLRDGLLTHLI
jgi:uncharacterized protein (DUF1015 family)